MANEPPEVFQVNFILSQDQQGSEIVNPVSMVTIIDDDVGEFENCCLKTSFGSLLTVSLPHFPSLHTHIRRSQSS